MKRLLPAILSVSVTLVTASYIAAPAGSNARADGPTTSLDPSIEARAKAITIKPQDLPVGWTADPTWRENPRTYKPSWSCNGHTADLAGLVTRGVWSARDNFIDRSGLWQITSEVTIFASKRQATLFFNDGAFYYPHYCALVGTKQGGGVLKTMSRISVSSVADAQIGFRTVFVGNNRQGWGDFILLRRGNVFGILEFARPARAFPTRLETAIIKKFAARAHL